MELDARARESFRQKVRRRFLGERDWRAALLLVAARGDPITRFSFRKQRGVARRKGESGGGRRAAGCLRLRRNRLAARIHRTQRRLKSWTGGGRRHRAAVLSQSATARRKIGFGSRGGTNGREDQREVNPGEQRSCGQALHEVMVLHVESVVNTRGQRPIVLRTEVRSATESMPS